MILRLVFSMSLFCVDMMLVFGTERSLVPGIAGGVIAAGILKYFFVLVAKDDDVVNIGASGSGYQMWNEILGC